jgi:predicted HAD superfamily phosphohydrolase YqeG
MGVGSSVCTVHCTAELERVVGICRRLEPDVLVLDLEPLLLRWDAADEQLELSWARFLRLIRGSTVRMVLVVSSSRRELSLVTPRDLHVRVVRRARKPLVSRATLGLYGGAGRRGVVCGDVSLTDGLLAARLGYTFVHVEAPGRPLYPVIQDFVGKALFGWLFKNCEQS